MGEGLESFVGLPLAASMSVSREALWPLVGTTANPIGGGALHFHNQHA
jgi:hypothetical protein